MAIGLGPVARVVDHDPRWPRLYEEERARILVAIGPWVAGIEHVGSTAVRGLAAKPIIDVLVGIRALADAVHCIPHLQAIGYEYVPEYEKELPERRYFRKGPVENRTHHLHLVEKGGEFWTSHLRFRDYLRDHPEAVRDYDALKRSLAAKYENDRDAYTESKAEFIRAILRVAVAEGY